MLTLQNFSASISGLKILHQISITLLPGSIINFHGFNGIGKTTLLRHLSTLNDLHDLKSEQLLYNGKSITDYVNEYRILVNYVGHNNTLFHNKTVLENLDFWANMYSTQEALDATIKCFALEPFLFKPAASLSKGWQRKLSLARLLLKAAPIWVIDEPFANLDNSTSNNLKNIFFSKVSQGGIIIISSHNESDMDYTINFNLKDYIACQDSQ